MKHPDSKVQRNQEEFLENCPYGEKEFHARLFRIGNAAYRYHQLAGLTDEIPEEYYHEWLEGRPANIRASMEKKGFEACKSMLPFTRYVNERRDIGMDEWMKKHLSKEDYNYYKNNQ